MRYRIGIIIALLTFPLSRTVAQTGPQTPSREQQRLQMFVGRWAYHGQVNKTVLSAAAQWNGTNHTFELFPGRFFLVHRWDDDKNDHGVLEQGIEIMSYDMAKHVYITRSYSSRGDAASYTHTWVGDTLRYADDTLRHNGKTGIERCVGVIARTTFTVDCRVSLDGKTWEAESHGVWTRRP